MDDKKKKNTPVDNENAVFPASPQSIVSDAPVHDDAAEVVDQAADYLLGWQRARADYDNLKREMDGKIAAIGEIAKLSVAQELIPVIDNFQKAREHVPPDQQAMPWVTGIFHIQKQLDGIMANLGITKMEVVGTPFDPTLHEAVGSEPGDEGMVVKEVRAGYTCEGRTVIPALVIVGNND